MLVRGNIRLGRIQEDTVDLQQDLRDTNGERWFYWNFRVRGVAGRMLCFKFANGNPIGVRGPAVSTDGGRAWSWLGAKAVNDTSFHYAFAKNAGEIRFCFAVPYQQADLQRFLGRHADSEYLSFGQGDPTIGPEVVAGKAQGRM